MFIPYKVDVPMQRLPWANWLLMAATIIISIGLFAPLEQWGESIRGAALLNHAGIKVDIPAPDGVLNYFILQPSQFHPAQLLGHLFAHEGWLHLLGNMLFLWVFGNAVNAKIGQWQYLALYLGAGALEGLVWLAVGPHMPALGASGAIMAVVGAFLFLYPLNDISCVLLWGWIVRDVAFASGWLIALYFACDLYGTFFNGRAGVGYLAHVAGFLTGASLIALLLWRRVVEPARGERTLLQAWGWMPETDEEEEAVPRVAAPIRRAPVKPRDTSPISMD